MGSPKSSGGGIPREFKPFGNEALGLLEDTQRPPISFGGLPIEGLRVGQSAARGAGLEPGGGGTLEDLVAQSLATIQQGMTTDGFVPNVLKSVESRLRPMTELSKDVLKSDVLESAAMLGQTRSSGTVESLARGFGGLEAQLQGVLGNIEGTLAPIQAQQPLQSASMGMQAPRGILDIIQQSMAPSMQESQFRRQLGSSIIGGAPFNAPSVGPSVGSQLLSAAAQIGAGWLMGGPAGAGVGAGTAANQAYKGAQSGKG